MSGLELLYALRESEREHIVVKIKVKGDDRPLIGAVDQIVGKDVILKPYTLYGEKIHKTVIPIFEIEKLVKIHLIYNNGIFPLHARPPVPGQTKAGSKKIPKKRI
jgi:hypothetical protein